MTWGDLGVSLGSLWGHFGVTLGTLWGHFGITLGDFWVTLNNSNRSNHNLQLHLSVSKIIIYVSFRSWGVIGPSLRKGSLRIQTIGVSCTCLAACLGGEAPGVMKV